MRSRPLPRVFIIGVPLILRFTSSRETPGNSWLHYPVVLCAPMSLKGLLHHVVDYPPLLDFARRVIEANHRGERDVIARELGETTGSVLDIPCGTGTYSTFFDATHYIGIDLIPKYVERAKKRFPDKDFRTMDALHLEFEDAAFEFILVCGFYHHLDDAEVARAIEETHRVLKPGGRCVLIEDHPTRSRWNLLGRFLQTLDQGAFIRPDSYYEELLRDRFEIRNVYPMQAGLWDYTVIVMDKPSS